MAKRRMFSLSIIDDDVFLGMPLSAQALYFHLGMRADDDGFITPLKVMRAVGANHDDLKILISRRYVLAFDSGVVVIKHWRINNTIQNDRYHSTTYGRELAELTSNEWGAYTEKSKIQQTLLDIENLQQLEADQQGPVKLPQQNVSKMETEVRLGKDSIGYIKTTTNVVAAKKPQKSEFGNPKVNAIFEFWEMQTQLPIKSKVQANRKAASILLNIYGEDKLKQLIIGAAAAQADRYAPSITDLISLKAKVNDLIIWGRKRQQGSNVEVI